jgi:putative membrane protein
MMWGYGGWNWQWMVPMMLVFWGALVALVVWGVGTVTRGSRGSDPALEALRKRLASGEITQEEYEKTKRILTA